MDYEQGLDFMALKSAKICSNSTKIKNLNQNSIKYDT